MQDLIIPSTHDGTKMKKILLLATTVFFSQALFAATDHFYLKEGNHIQHMKITKLNDEVIVTADVDFEPNANESNAKACAGDIAGQAKFISENELLMKKHAESAASYCELTINLTNTGATVKQSEGCNYFATGICHFSTANNELKKVN
jgi:hypothetical protein